MGTIMESAVAGWILSGDGDLLEDFLDDFGDGDSFDFEFGAEDNAVTDDGFGHCFDIIGGDEVATGDRGIGATGEEEGLGGAGASADEDGVVIAGGADEIDDVGDEFVANGDEIEGVAELSEIIGGDHGEDIAGGEVGFWGMGAEHAVGEGEFAGAIWGGHGDFEHEAIFLGFGEGIRPFIFGGVLGSENSELGGEIVGIAIDGDLSFLHCLEESGLGFGWGAIDFVGEKEGGEDGAFDEGELIGLEVKNAGAGNICGHEIWGKLDTIEGAAEDLGESANEEGFGDTWDAFDEGVMAGEDGDEGEIDDAILADDYLTDFSTGAGEDILDGLGICDHKEWRRSGFARERVDDGLVSGNGLALAWGLRLMSLQNLFCLSEFGGAMDA